MQCVCLWAALFRCVLLHHTCCAAPAAAHLLHLGVSAAADIIGFSYHNFSYDMSIFISSSSTITPSYHITNYLLIIFHHWFFHFIISSLDFSFSTSPLLTFTAFNLFLFIIIIIILISIIIIFHLSSSTSPSLFLLCCDAWILSLNHCIYDAWSRLGWYGAGGARWHMV